MHIYGATGCIPRSERADIETGKPLRNVCIDKLDAFHDPKERILKHALIKCLIAII